MVGAAVAAGLFFLAVTVAAHGDLSTNPESAVPTVAVASGEVRCMYPGSALNVPIVAPLFPLVASVLQAPLAFGQVRQRPGSAPCTTTWATTTRWLNHRISHMLFVLAGWAMWLVLLGGATSLLRTSERARTRWELLTLLGLAVAPPIVESLSFEFHPEDLLSVGLLLLAVSETLRGRAVSAGLAAAGAVLSQQFALLGVVVLVVAAPRALRVRLVSAGAFGAFVVLAPLAWLTNARVLSSFEGVGFTPGGGGTFVSQLGLAHAGVVVLSRLVPLLAAFATAVYFRRRLGDRLATPDALVALMALALSWRLLLEVNLYGYYFMAVAALLVVLYASRGALSWSLTAWLITLTLAYPPFSFVPTLFLGGPTSWVEPELLALWGAAMAVRVLRAPLSTGPELVAQLQ